MSEQKIDENQKQQQKQQLTPEEEKLLEDVKLKLEEVRLKNIEVLRGLHPQKVLSKKQHEILLSIKEEELTEADKTRLAWATLRLKHHGYTGSGHSIEQKKKSKLKRRMAKVSRKANR